MTNPEKLDEIGKYVDMAIPIVNAFQTGLEKGDLAERMLKLAKNYVGVKQRGSYENQSIAK